MSNLEVRHVTVALGIREDGYRTPRILDSTQGTHNHIHNTEAAEFIKAQDGKVAYALTSLGDSPAVTDIEGKVHVPEKLYSESKVQQIIDAVRSGNLLCRG